jgi:pimeloyl-ACP methyl ester carboxylesterase
MPRVMLLHGFPEAAFAWDEVMTRLAPQARCLAPNLRGFEKSSAPAEVEAYRARHLMQDVEALIQQTGGPVDLLVAHDWGGAVAWNLAAIRPELMKRLLIINSPHPATFLRELRRNPAQQAASAYMNFFRMDKAERVLSENGYERLLKMFNATASGQSALDDEDIPRYREAWSQPGALTGALNLYRASPLYPPTADDPGAAALKLDPAALTVRVPTLVIWGEADTALGTVLLEGLDELVPDLNVARMPQGSHWVIHEQPRQVNAAIRVFLASG